MNESLLFSVCVCTYKNIDQLERTIRSIAKQKYQWIQLVISDDCSDDDFVNLRKQISDIVDIYRNRFCDVIININSTNIGTVRNLNAALPYIKGSFITLLGAGDEFAEDDILECVARYLDNNRDIDYVVSRNELILPDGHKCYQPDMRYRNALKNADIEKLLKLESRGYSQLCSIGAFYKKIVYDKYGTYDERFVLLEDAPFSYKLLLNKAKIGYIDRVSCFHYAGGISNSKVKNSTLERDSVNTILYLKYPNRYRLDRFSRRIVEFKKLVRVDRRLLYGCLVYPDAACYIFFEVAKDWIRRGRYLK